MKERLIEILRWTVFLLPGIFYGWCLYEYFYSENFLSYPDIHSITDARGLSIYKLSFEYIFRLCLIYLEYVVYISAWIVWTAVLAPVGYMIYWYFTSLGYFLLTLKFGLVIVWGLSLGLGTAFIIMLGFASYHLWTSSIETLSKKGWRSLFFELFWKFVTAVAGLLILYSFTFDFFGKWLL